MQLRKFLLCSRPGTDPVKAGLVASLNRPGSNITDVTLIGYELDAKRLQLLHELVPKATTIGVVVNTKNPSVPPALPDMKAAADLNGQRLARLQGREHRFQFVFSSRALTHC